MLVACSSGIIYGSSLFAILLCSNLVLEAQVLSTKSIPVLLINRSGMFTVNSREA